MPHPLYQTHPTEYHTPLLLYMKRMMIYHVIKNVRHYIILILFKAILGDIM
jgi:hypothetical protein